jgi:hypothetical protein
MTRDDIVQARKQPDAIACGDWFVDIHNPKGEGTSISRPPEGDWYEIPYRSTTAHGLGNLLIASRCLDATHEAHAAIRASNQICAVGEGVGAAAAQVIARRLPDIRCVDMEQLQATLRKSGVMLRDENGMLR